VIPAGLVALKEALYALSGPLSALEDMADSEDLAASLLVIDDIVSEAAQLKRLLSAHLAGAMEGKYLELEGLASFERHRETKRSWDHAMVAGQVAEATRVDRESGELLCSPEAAEVITEGFLSCAGINYWRIGALRSLLGADLAEKHCEVVHGDPTVTIRRVGK
jgi:hypothetical protein